MQNFLRAASLTSVADFGFVKKEGFYLNEQHRGDECGENHTFRLNTQKADCEGKERKGKERRKHLGL